MDENVHQENEEFVNDPLESLITIRFMGKIEDFFALRSILLKKCCAIVMPLGLRGRLH